MLEYYFKISELEIFKELFRLFFNKLKIKSELRIECYPVS